MSEVEKVKEIIQRDLEIEASRLTSNIQESIDRELKEAIDKINNVYTSALTTLQKLEIADATLFDFFEKTQGNIRIYENVAGYDRDMKSIPSEDFAFCLKTKLNLECRGIRLGYNEYGKEVIPPIELREGKKYKVIVMAMELKEEK